MQGYMNLLLNNLIFQPRRKRRPTNGFSGKRKKYNYSIKNKWRKSPVKRHYLSFSRLTTKLTAYHGTPSLDNVKSILKDGWMVGRGNVMGDGIYLANNIRTAKSYAGTNGYYLKCVINARRKAVWGDSLSARYAKWCQAKGVTSDNSARSAFLIQNGFDVAQNGNVLIVLAPQYVNPTAWKKKRSRKIRVIGIYRASDDRRVSVR